MDDSSAPQIPLLILDGIHSENEGIAIARMLQIVNYPSLVALRELLEVLEKEGREEPVNAAARNAAAQIIAKAQGKEKMDMLSRVLSGSEKNAEGIMLLLSNNANALPLEVKKFALVSQSLGIETKAALIRNSGAEDSHELLELLRISNASDKFEVIWNVAGAATKDEALRIKAMRELASFGNESAIELFQASLGNESPNLRNQALLGLISLWSEDSENSVERILCEHLAQEKDPGIKLNIVQWIGQNGRHTISEKALVGLAASEEDPKLVSAAEAAFEKIGERLLAKPAKFQSGRGVFDTLTPQAEGRATIDADVPQENRESQPALAAESPLKSDVRELANGLKNPKKEERKDAADALALIALATRDRKELMHIEKLLSGRGEEFGHHLRRIRAMLKKMPFSTDGGKMAGQPSWRMTPRVPPMADSEGRIAGALSTLPPAKKP